MAVTEEDYSLVGKILNVVMDKSKIPLGLEPIFQGKVIAVNNRYITIQSLTDKDTFGISIRDEDYRSGVTVSINIDYIVMIMFIET